MRAESLEIDVAMIEFVERYARTPIKWDIVAFFAENPYTRDTPTQIAGRIGRTVVGVSRDLDDLVLLGLLRRVRVEDEMIYQLASGSSTREAVGHFAAVVELSASADRR